MSHVEPQVIAPPTEQEIDIVDFWTVLVRRHRFILGLAGGAAVVALVVSLLLPKWYESTVTILPQLESKDKTALAALLAVAGGSGVAQNLGIALPDVPATPTDLFVAMLKSRSMADEVIKQFDLVSRYDEDTLQETRDELEDHVRVVVTREKVIKVTVEDTDPGVAADIANFFGSHLDHLNRTVTVSKASQNRAFIERRLGETQVALAQAEEDLKDFQTKNKTVAVEAQSKVMIEAAALLQGQITAQEVQLEVMGSYLSRDHPELARLRSSIDELRKQLRIMESGKSGKGMLPGDRLHPAMITVPELALMYGRLLREVKIQETIYGLLTSQFEQAKIAEARDTPTVQVLDQGVPADKKSRPRILLNTAVAAVFALMVGVFVAMVQESRARARRPVSAPTG